MQPGWQDLNRSLRGSLTPHWHLPSDWKGVRYGHPVITWICGESTDRVRNTLQEKLFGPLGQWGDRDDSQRSALISRPSSCAQESPGLSTSPGSSTCPLVTGQPSVLLLRPGRDKYQGSTVHRILNDEEPPADIVGEQKMRLVKHDGHLSFTYTPLSGYTANHSWLMESDNVARFNITMDDLPWMTPERIEKALEDCLITRSGRVDTVRLLPLQALSISSRKSNTLVNPSKSLAIGPGFQGSIAASTTRQRPCRWHGIVNPIASIYQKCGHRARASLKLPCT